jgi:superfamily II RNA helicase
MPILSHTMPESDWEVRERIKEVFSFMPCFWQIHVVCTILNGDDVITIAKTGSGKSMTYLLATYWMPVLFIKYGILVIVTPLKLLRSQFAQTLEDNHISAISVTAANITNELFEVNLSIGISYFTSFYDYGKLWYYME